MVCFRSRRLAAGFFVSCVVLGACGKKEEGSGGGAQGGASAAKNQDLAVIPAESEVVFGVDFSQGQKSALFKDYVLPALTRSEEAQKRLAALKAKCNIDPLAEITRVTGGVRGIGGGGEPEVTLVVHGVAKAKALACPDQMKEELAADQVEVVKDGDVVLFKNERSTTAITFTGDTTAVLVVGPKATKEAVLAAAQGKSALPGSKEFGEMYGRLQSAHTIWFLLKGNTEPLAKLLSQLNVRAKAIYGSLNATTDLEIQTFMRTETEEQAGNIVDLVKSQAGAAEQMLSLEKIDVDRDKADVRFGVKLNPDQLKKVAGLMRAFGPRMR